MTHDFWVSELYSRIRSFAILLNFHHEWFFVLQKNVFSPYFYIIFCFKKKKICFSKVEIRVEEPSETEVNVLKMWREHILRTSKERRKVKKNSRIRRSMSKSFPCGAQAWCELSWKYRVFYEGSRSLRKARNIFPLCCQGSQVLIGYRNFKGIVFWEQATASICLAVLLSEYGNDGFTRRCNYRKLHRESWLATARKLFERWVVSGPWMLHKVKAHKLVDVEFNLNMYLVPLSSILPSISSYKIIDDELYEFNNPFKWKRISSYRSARKVPAARLSDRRPNPQSVELVKDWYNIEIKELRNN